MVAMDELNLTSELLALLDLIELQTEDQRIKDLTKQRFAIAEEHGYTVVLGELISGEIN